MFKPFSYTIIVGIAIAGNALHGASSKQELQPITHERITYLPRYTETFFLENGETINSLEELKKNEEVSCVWVTNGRFSSTIFLPSLKPTEIPAYIKEQMLDSDPDYPESAVYKQIAASMRMIQERAQKQGTNRAPAPSLPAGSRERYSALNLKTGQHRVMAHKYDLREGEILNGVEILFDRSA